MWRACGPTETGQRVPPDEVVEAMSDLYNTLHLIVRHVREKNAMYGRVVPEVPKMDVLEASARLTNRIYSYTYIYCRQAAYADC